MASWDVQVTAEEHELGWEVIRQAAALAASSHGQSSLTTRQLLHGACAGLRSIRQEQMDFMVGHPMVQSSPGSKAVSLRVYVLWHPKLCQIADEVPRMLTCSGGLVNWPNPDGYDDKPCMKYCMWPTS